MFKCPNFALAGLICLALAPAAAQAARADGDSIPFAGQSGIRSWTASDDHTLYLQSAQGQWYDVVLMGPCRGLQSAFRIGVATGPIDTFDRFSSIIVDGQRCAVSSVTRVPGPPSRNK